MSTFLGTPVEDPTFESFVPHVKQRDGYRCVNGCAPKGPVNDIGQPKLLRVVRKVAWEADSMANLETVCGHRGSKCVPSWEA